MISNKPYLVRAIYDWCNDTELTPHILVDTSQNGVKVPQEFIEDNRIVLNISDEATKSLKMEAESVSFMANFSHRVMTVMVPIEAIIAIYAYENGEGITFSEEEEGEIGGVSSCFTEIDIDVSSSDNESSIGKNTQTSKKPVLTIIK